MEPFILFKRGNVWYYRLAGERTFHSAHTSVRKEARKLAYQKATARATGVAQTFREYSEPFFDYDRCPHVARLRALGRSIGRDYAADARRILASMVWSDPLALVQMADLRPGHFFDMIGRLSKKHSPRMVNKALSAAKVVVREAFRRGDLQIDPAASVGLMREPRAERSRLTSVEIDALFAATGWRSEEARVGNLILADTGMRSGELVVLRWQDIDLDERIVNIVRAWKRKDGEGAPKWGKVRWVPLTMRLCEVLTDWRARNEWALPADFVLAHRNAQRYSREAVLRWFRVAMDLIGVDWRARGLSPHSYRHTFASRAREVGTPLWLVQRMLAHSDEATTNRYTHPELGEARRWIDRM